MSGKRNCYVNAPMKSFLGTLRTELIFHRHFETKKEAVREITEYIELFYNLQKRKEKPGDLSPAAFEHRFNVKKKLLVGLVSTFDDRRHL